MTIRGVARGPHHLHVDRNPRLHALGHRQELGQPALEYEAVQRAAQGRVGAGAQDHPLGADRLGHRDHGQDGDPTRGRLRANPLDERGKLLVGDVRAQDHEVGGAAGESVEEVGARGDSAHEIGVALEEAHLQLELADVEAGGEDGVFHLALLAERPLATPPESEEALEAVGQDRLEPEQRRHPIIVENQPVVPPPPGASSRATKP